MARIDDHSKEVFKPPPPREFFTPGTSLLIGIFLLVMISLGVASLLIQVTIVMYLLLLILLTFAGLALELWLLR